MQHSLKNRKLKLKFEDKHLLFVPHAMSIHIIQIFAKNVFLPSRFGKKMYLKIKFAFNRKQIM